MSKHAPGPWTIENHCEIFDKNGEGVCVPYSFNGYDRVNAILISAAPDLLEALERMVKYFKDNNWTEADHDFLAKCKQAIAKAKGE